MKIEEFLATGTIRAYEELKTPLPEEVAIVRTSVDHGTAFDIAGRGAASPESLLPAVELAAQLARNR